MLSNYLEKQRVLVRGLPVEKPANPNPEQIFADELKQLKEQNLYRSLRTMDSEQSKYIEMQGRKVLMLASNSYLDLAADTRVKQAAAEAALQWGAGSGGSRLTTGNTALHEALESKLAQFKGTEAALVFNTGYMANVALFPPSATVKALSSATNTITPASSTAHVFPKRASLSISTMICRTWKRKSLLPPAAGD